MAFKSQAEQSKWDALQHTGEQSIEKLLKGEATPADIEKLSKLVAQQSALAGKIFDAGIESAESTTDAIIDKMNKDRIAIGKNPLTPKAQDRIFKQTFQNVLKASTEDILGSVHDQLEIQTEQIQDSLDTVAERLHQIQTDRKEREASEQPTRSLADRVGSLIKIIKEGSAGAIATSASGLRRIATKSSEVLASGKEATGKGIRQFGEAIRNPRRTLDTATTYLRSSVGAMKEAVVDGWRKLTSRNEEDDEDKKSSTWLRKLKSMFGSVKDKFDKGKKVTSMLGKIFGPIGKILLLALTNPQLIKTITDAVSQYLNFDTISDFVESTWKDIKKGGSDIIDWIIDKVKTIFGGGPDEAAKAKNLATGQKAVKANQTTLVKDSTVPANTTLTDARAAIPQIQNDLNVTQANLDAAKKRLAANPSEENKLTVTSLTLRVQKLKGQLSGYTKVLAQPTSKPGDTQTAPVVPSGGTGGTDSTAGMPQAGDTQNRTTVVPTALSGATGPSPASIAASTVAVGSMPQFKEGIAIEAPRPDQALPEGNKSANNVAPGGGIISLGSFGYNSGDDTLNLLNMGLIA